MESTSSPPVPAGVGAQIGATVWLLPAVVFTFGMTWTNPKITTEYSMFVLMAKVLTWREDILFYPLQNWLYILCLHFLMPLSTAYYLMRVLISRGDVLRMCIYGLIHYVLILWTWATHGAMWQGFLMLSVSTLWLSGVLLYEVYRLRWSRTNSPA